MTNQNVVFPRVCSATGVGIFEGYLCEDGEIFKHEADLLQWIKNRGEWDEDLSDEYILDEAYELEEYLWTEWEADDVVVNENARTISFMYFANNFPHDWIDKVWQNDVRLSKHMKGKWDSMNQSNQLGGTVNFFKLFMELDNGNRNTLCDWIANNYKG